MKSSFSKILVSVGFFVLATFIVAIISGARGGGRPGILGIIVVFGLIAGLRAIWKKDKNSDNTKLNKED